MSVLTVEQMMDDLQACVAVSATAASTTAAAIPPSAPSGVEWLQAQAADVDGAREDVLFRLLASCCHCHCHCRRHRRADCAAAGQAERAISAASSPSPEGPAVGAPSSPPLPLPMTADTGLRQQSTTDAPVAGGARLGPVDPAAKRALYQQAFDLCVDFLGVHAAVQAAATEMLPQMSATVEKLKVEVSAAIAGLSAVLESDQNNVKV
ncbi:hypothetical protein CAOG_00025 [Capsaspora owczarzaki ATCC 30864]|uniref:hypothetical protein n=1 Tax=Capsaspora owczarzaki (strain ATCC 30864) TaxID=595528 RepID=UPI0003525453|nr:hypothetical protein CAOG_00025 [Capsaspora owczarzaki ATCC 30864]|eukprot:XP_004364896.2 hypothetical protein CAOG_00025 [Capsaspora owczarzaki ATCC 30864]